MTETAGRWGDLGLRIASAAVLAVVGGAILYAGGGLFVALVILCAGLMCWELARLGRAEGAVAVMLGLTCAAALYLASRFSGPWPLAILLFAVVASAPGLPKGWRAWLLYAPVILVGAYGMLSFRAAGLPVALWVVLVAIASDLAGYFLGRMIGGPKFWPSLSPKKTWSGTVAGWLSAVAVGAGFWLWGGSAHLLWLSPVLAFAAQLGDIAESAVKRRAGVKDASHLIPGHGGLLDRFDGFLGASVALVIAGVVAGLPLD